MEAGCLVGAVSIINWPRAMPSGMMGVVSVPGIGSILHIVYLLCDFLLLHLGRGAQEGPIVPPQCKSAVRPNKKPHCSSFSCLHRCAFPAGGCGISIPQGQISARLWSPNFTVWGWCGSSSNGHVIHFLLLVRKPSWSCCHGANCHVKAPLNTFSVSNRRPTAGLISSPTPEVWASFLKVQRDGAEMWRRTRGGNRISLWKEH